MAMENYDLVGLVTAAREIGKAVAESGMFGAKNVGQGVIIALHCLQSGMPILNYQREFHLVDGKPSKKSEAMLADFNKLGGKHRWLKDGRDGESAELELTLGGNTITSVYTMAEAEAANLVKTDSGWKKNPANLLRARATSNGVRMIAPEVVVGCYTPEEIADFEGGDQQPPSEYGQQIEPPAKRRKKETEAAPVQPAAPVPVTESPQAAVTTVPPVAATVPAVSTASATPPASTVPAAPAPVAPAASAVSAEILQQISLICKEIGLDGKHPSWQAGLKHFDLPVDPASGLRKVGLGTQQQAEAVLGWLHAQQKKLAAKAAGKTAEAWANQAVGQTAAKA